jgi:hypothetical protein
MQLVDYFIHYFITDKIKYLMHTTTIICIRDVQ